MVIDDDCALTPPRLRSKIRRMRSGYDVSIVVVDYLQLMEVPGRHENRTSEVSALSRALKSVAKETGVVILAVSQLSRGVESRKQKRPMLRESGAIEQDADLVLMIYREAYYKPSAERMQPAEVIIRKNRNGPIGHVVLLWSPEYCKFVSRSFMAGDE
jgi:replicative DNA helicase